MYALIGLKDMSLKKIVRTLASAAAARLFASFSAFFARPLSFFPFAPLGAIVVST